MSDNPRIVVLSGGVGGARFIDGLRRVVPPDRLTVVVNTGDDLWHWGLRVCPDLDTILYTLARLAPRERGWGIDEDTVRVFDRMKRLGEPDWFLLGDQDIATHLYRTRRLRSGASLTEVTRALFAAHDVGADVLPVTDQEAPTRIRSGDTTLEFQEWLVKTHAQAACHEVLLPSDVEASDEVLAALRHADLVFITPSNPFVSIDPILNCGGIRGLLDQRTVVGVSPIIGQRAVKGPLGGMLADRGDGRVSAGAVARHYAPFLDGFIVAYGDADTVDNNVRCAETDILIVDDAARVALAEFSLAFAEQLR